MSQRMYSVGSLVHYIKETLDHDFALQSILIKGEVSNFTNHRSGHWYFTLKDAKAKISCVMFASYASRTRILLKEGMKVIVTASVSMYEASGNVQLYVTKVQVDGLGDLFLQLEAVKLKMSKEGLFDAIHKKPLPTYPMNIGIVTAKTGAAIQDMLTTISRRWPIADVVVYPTLVQGIQASEAMITQLKKADEAGHDVILLARGGGAIEDLWCFNDETLARTIFSMHTVLVSGVGHESDTTLVDYVSDARAPTPTAAAELITPDIQEVKALIAMQRVHLLQCMNRNLDEQKKRLTLAKSNRYIQDPNAYIREAQMKLAMHVKELGIVDVQTREWKQQLQQASHQMAILSERIRSSKRSSLQENYSNLQHALEQFKKSSEGNLREKAMLLDAYSPLKVLARGYQIAYHEEHIIKSIHDVHEEDMVKLRMQDGCLYAEVKKKEAL